MKIRALDLRAFGPFTDRRLSFAPQSGSELHVIYGPNEAGKSSALRAIHAALFGIEAQTSDNFLHAYPDLRVGMSLEKPAGEVLEFVRRKSQKQKIWNPEESRSLSEDLLAQFLGGLDRAEFNRVFGLDHIRLREGTERLLDAAEGTEAAVVGAALGVRDLSDIRLQLEKEAGALFAARAHKANINKAFSEWREKKRDLAQASLSTESWKQTRRNVDRAQAAREAILQKERALQQRLEELEFVRRNRHRVKDWRQLEEELGSLADVRLLPADFAERFRSADNARREALRDRDQFALEEKDLRERLDALPEQFSLCEQEPQLENLRETASKVRGASQDSQRLRARAEGCEASADAVAVTLGFPTPLTRARISELQLLMGAPADFCRDLVKEYTRLQATFGDGAERLVDRKAELVVAEQAVERVGASADTAALQAVRRSALQLGEPETDLTALREQQEQLRRAMDRDLARLPGFAGTAESLLESPMPGSEALEAFRLRFQDLDTEQRDAQMQLRDLGKSRSRVESRLAAVAAGGDLLSLESLAEARSRRDQLWSLTREALASGTEDTQAVAAIDPKRSLVDALTSSIEQADRIADGLRLESERVAEISELRRQLEEVDRMDASLSQAEVDRKARRAALEEEWVDAWKDSGLTVGDWPVMQDAMQICDGIRRHLEELESCLFRMEQLQDRVDRIRGELCDAIASCGGGRPDPSRSLADCLAIAEDFAGKLEDRAQSAREARIKYEELRTGLAREQQGQDHRGRQLDDWRIQFATATREFPLRKEDPPEAVEGVLRRIEALLKEIHEANGLRDRIEKIEIDREELDTKLGDFCRTYAPELPQTDRAATLASLFQMLEEQKAHRRDYQRLAGELASRRKARESAERTLEIAESNMEALTREAVVETVDDLPESIRRADEKRQLQEKRETLEKHFSGEDVPLEDLVARVEEMNSVDLNEEMLPVRTELDLVSSQRAELVEAATLASADFQAMENETGADSLALDLAEVEAGLRDPFERYATLLFASRMLSSAVESYRERNEAPLLGFASSYFAQLTRGRYNRIETELESGSDAGFRVRSTASSRSKPLHSLSEGTVDQLHLALVLGSLQHRFSAGAEAMPLLLDDILVHFDDDRSLAALETLVDFAKTTQVLLFTHHERVRDQGLEVGGVIHDLQQA